MRTGQALRARMSHVPLLARSTVPKLQAPRRAPQVLLLCMVVTVVLLVLPRGTFDALAWNATRVAPDPPPDAVRRTIELAALHRREDYELRYHDQEREDLLATVGYLAKRALGSR